MRVTCGASSTFVISDSGLVYHWGIALTPQHNHLFLPTSFDKLNELNFYIARISSGLMSSAFIADENHTNKYQMLARQCFDPTYLSMEQLKINLLSIPTRMNTLQNRAHKWLSDSSSKFYPNFTVTKSFFLFQASERNSRATLDPTESFSEGYSHFSCEVFSIKNESETSLKVTIHLPKAELYQSSRFRFELEPLSFELQRVWEIFFSENYFYALTF